jgi:hypothetical protein
MTNKFRTADESTAPYHRRYFARCRSEKSPHKAFTGDTRSPVAFRYDRPHALGLSHLFRGDDKPTTPPTGVVKLALSECVVSGRPDGQRSVSTGAVRRTLDQTAESAIVEVGYNSGNTPTS